MFARQQQQQPIVTDQNKSFEDYQQQQQQPTNYDMTILHVDFEDDDDEEEDDSFIYATKTSTNQKKPIPQWARSMFDIINRSMLIYILLENELQIAICNQIYFHRNPSEIFGNSMDCSPAHLRTILHSMLPKVNFFDETFHQTPTINSNQSILV